MTTESRPLETLIKEFNFFSQVDRDIFGILGDRPATKGWLESLSQEEREIFQTHIAEIVDETAKALGFEDAVELTRSIGRKLASGIVMGLTTGIAS